MKKNEIAKIESSKRSGICKYCRNLVIVDAPEDYSDQEVNDLATEKCDCSEAKKERSRKARMKKAAEWAKDRFSQNDGQMQTVICAIMAVFDGGFDKVTIKAGKETYKIDKDKNWMMRIQHEYKDQRREEF